MCPRTYEEENMKFRVRCAARAAWACACRPDVASARVCSLSALCSPRQIFTEVVTDLEARRKKEEARKRALEEEGGKGKGAKGGKGKKK